MLFLAVAATTLMFAQSGEYETGSHFQANIEVSGQWTRMNCVTVSVDNKSFTVLDNAKTDWLGASLDATFGARIRRWVFVGGGIGLHSLYTGPTDEQFKAAQAGEYVGLKPLAVKVYAPIYADVRFFIPTSKNINPFVEGAAGCYIGWIDGMYYTDNQQTTLKQLPGSSTDMKAGYYMRLGIGCEFKRFILGVGYELMASTKKEINYNALVQDIDQKTHQLYVKVGVRIGRM